MDSFRVLVVLTDDTGTGMHFWLVFRMLNWYVDNPQYTHVRKVLAWEGTNDRLILRTATGHVLELQLLVRDHDLNTWHGASKQRTRDAREWRRTDRRQVATLRNQIRSGLIQ